LPAAGLGFTRPIPHGGYAWWYIDALSDDHRHGLTLIALLGSVFSPYYAAARARGEGDPHDHVACNIVLYGPHGKHWAMTERGRGAWQAKDDAMTIGPSRLRWTRSELCAVIDEVTVPWPRRLRGELSIRLAVAPAPKPYSLDATGAHLWQPLYPRAPIEVRFAQPSLGWRGTAYVDSNRGSVPLESTLRSWHWARAHHADETWITYDVEPRAGEPVSHALCFAHDGTARPWEAGPLQALPATGWRIARSIRTDCREAARVRSTLEDTPFYARSLIDTVWQGEPVTAVHESLSLPRFVAPWVRLLLPFRMPRRA
jgi:carotenoid 1,2-hydratase